MPGKRRVVTITVLVVWGLISVGLAEAAKRPSGPGTVSGTVESGCQPAGKVLVYLAGRSFVAYTDADGSFLLEGVPGGTYMLHLESSEAEHDQVVVVSAGSGTDVGTILLGPSSDGTPCDTGLAGACATGALQSCTCVQTVFPTTEVCDGVDNNCDGQADEGPPPCAPGLVCSLGCCHPLGQACP